MSLLRIFILISVDLDLDNLGLNSIEQYRAPDYHQLDLLLNVTYDTNYGIRHWAGPC